MLIVLDSLYVLTSRDVACAQQAARPGTLAALAEALRLHGAGSRNLAVVASIVLATIAPHVPPSELTAAAESCVTAMHAMLIAHGHLGMQGVWSSIARVLDSSRNKRAAARVGAAGLVVDALRTLRRVADDPAAANEDADALTLEFLMTVCDVLALLTHLDERNRHAALEEGAVPVLMSVLRTYGVENDVTAGRVCTALGHLLYDAHVWNFHGDDAFLDLVADLTMVMRVHVASENLQSRAFVVLLSFTVAFLHLCTAAAAAHAAPFDASHVARRLADAGALDAAAAALRAHAAIGPERLLNEALFVLLVACSGAPVASTGTPLRASVANRAAQAGVGAALAAALSRAPLPDDRLHTRAAALAAAVARLPPPRACGNCGTTDAAKLKRCSRCLAARFCSAACQRAAWPAHKLVCVPPTQAAAQQPDA